MFILISIQIYGLNDSTLSFKSYLKLLNNNNLSIKIKKNIIKKKSISLKQSYNNFLPTVDFNYGATINSKNDSIFSKYIPGSSPTPQNPSWTKNLTINLPIFLGGKRFSLLKINKSNKKLSEYELKTIILNLKSQAISLFIKAYNLQNKLKILQKSLDLAQKNYENAKLLSTVGRLVRVDLLTFKLSYEERKSSILNTQTEIDNTFLEMSSLVNKKILPIELTIENDIPKNIIKTEKSKLITQFIKKLEKNSPIIKQNEEILKLSRYNLDLSKKNYWPNINLRYNYSPYTENFWEFPITKGHSLSLILSFNIFNSFKDSADNKIKRLDLTNTELQLQETLKNQKTAIKKAINVLKNSLLQEKSLKLALKLSQEKLKQIKIGYKHGKYNILDILKAENDSLFKENNLVNLKTQIYNSYYQLKILSGNIHD